MKKVGIKQLILFFSVLIIVQSIWINLRLNELERTSPSSLIAEFNKKRQEELKEVLEPEVKEKLASGGRLWLEIDESRLSEGLDLQIWAETEEPVKSVDLRLFYPPDLLKLTKRRSLVLQSV